MSDYMENDPLARLEQELSMEPGADTTLEDLSGLHDYVSERDTVYSNFGKTGDDYAAQFIDAFTEHYPDFDIDECADEVTSSAESDDDIQLYVESRHPFEFLLGRTLLIDPNFLKSIGDKTNSKSLFIEKVQLSGDLKQLFGKAACGGWFTKMLDFAFPTFADFAPLPLETLANMDLHISGSSPMLRRVYRKELTPLSHIFELEANSVIEISSAPSHIERPVTELAYRLGETSGIEAFETTNLFDFLQPGAVRQRVKWFEAQEHFIGLELAALCVPHDIPVEEVGQGIQNRVGEVSQVVHDTLANFFTLHAKSQ